MFRQAEFRPIQFIRRLLAALFPNIFPLIGPKAKITRFDLEVVEGATTERRSTGERGSDFRFYPVLQLTPDVNGDFRVEWNWENFFDGARISWSEPTIVNTFTDLIAGQSYEFRLIDNRDPATTGRDPAREGAIAIGDVDFIALGAQDGNWHSFQSNVTGRVVSPSGATVDISGQLGPEDFRSWGVLAASLRTTWEVVVAP